MKKSLIVLLFTALFPALLSGCAGLGVATVGAVMYYKSQSHEVATVDIKAPAANIYNTALNIVNNNANVALVQQDDAAMLLDISQDDTAASIKVAQVSRSISQLTISADSSESDGASRVLEGVFKICKELNVECQLSE
ncbi:DUF3568 domain-containing protein [Moritella sp. Urea-trap-13]|uniref:DUF3568 domain-containing protein n=1 Tax=Moritella sp. Urea-trap-13 TaxID=2058327 RepID=UPI000C31EA49|nr:DUF3568 domain-containing protein [Moritella sp. Urea-trap-13]PKH06772.1 DUF3568 domain-containing protein [Moritella sp. Urea-trap-13]